MRKQQSLAAWHPFSQEIRCHPEPFLCPLQRQATATIPAGHKKGEGSSRAFTQSKKPCVMTNRLLLGILFPKKNAVILSPFYARCIPTTTSIPAGHKKGEGSSRTFTPSKKPCANKDRLLLGISFAKKTLSSFALLMPITTPSNNHNPSRA